MNKVEFARSLPSALFRTKAKPGPKSHHSMLFQQRVVQLQRIIRESAVILYGTIIFIDHPNITAISWLAHITIFNLIYIKAMWQYYYEILYGKNKYVYVHNDKLKTFLFLDFIKKKSHTTHNILTYRFLIGETHIVAVYRSHHKYGL